MCRKQAVGPEIKRPCCSPHETQSVGFDMRAPSFQSETIKPCCMPCRVGPDRLCVHGRLCKLQAKKRTKCLVQHKHYSTQGSRAITQLSISRAQSSMTFVIGREGVLSFLWRSCFSFIYLLTNVLPNFMGQQGDSISRVNTSCSIRNYIQFTWLHQNCTIIL